MTIPWTPLVGSNYTGLLEAMVENDGTVNVRGTVTTTVNGVGATPAGAGASAVLPAAFNPRTSPNYLEWDVSTGKMAAVVLTGILQIGYFQLSGTTYTFDNKLSWQGFPPSVAAGGLITRDGQYEFNGILMNDSVGDRDTLRVIKTSGLFNLPDMKTVDSEMQDDHGGQVGRDLFAMRYITMDLSLIASTKANLYSKIDELREAFQTQEALLPLYFQRAGIGKRFIKARPRRLGGFDTSARMDHGRADGSLMLLAPDPRILEEPQRSQDIVIASGGTTNSGTVSMLGNFKGGAKPILEIAGPTTNPRITNAADEGRAIRIDMVIAAGQTLILDANDRSVTLAGVDMSANVRTDNQWWNLLAGNNLITFTRSNTPANTSTLTVKWWDSFA